MVVYIAHGSSCITFLVGPEVSIYPDHPARCLIDAQKVLVRLVLRFLDERVPQLVEERIKRCLGPGGYLDTGENLPDV